MRNFGLALVIVLGSGTLSAQSPLLDSIQVLGGAAVDNVVSITPDPAGNLFVLGSTQSPDFPTTATFGTSAGSPTNGADTFVAKINLSDWSLTWSVVIRPSVPLAMAIDSTGAVYVTCYSASPQNFPSTAGAFTGASGGPYGSLFVAKIDPTGSKIVYSSSLAPYQIYTGAPITVDAQGQAYVAASGAAPITAGAFLSTITSGNTGSYIAKLSADGSRVVFSTYLASSCTATPHAIAVDHQQNVYVAGVDSAYLSTFPTTPGVVQPTHVGNSNAFVMKFAPDGASLLFATLLGGTGGALPYILKVGDDGSIYLAGQCDVGSEASAVQPFPTTAGAPFRTFTGSTGFVTRLSADASSLLFSTYASNISNTAVVGFAISGGQIYAAYGAPTVQFLYGLNYSPPAEIRSTAVQMFDASSGAATAPAFMLPGLTPDGFAISGANLIVASNASQINLPVPSSIAPLGPLGLDPTKNAFLQSDITFGKFVLGGTPDHDIDTDRGYLVFESYPGATLQQTVNITSSAGGVPFHIFGPLPPTCCPAPTAGYSIVPQDGVTPAGVSISPGGYYTNEPPALLLVSPRASLPIQIVPSLEDDLAVRVQTPATILQLPATGGTGTSTIQLSATVSSPSTLFSASLSLPFYIGPGVLPPDLTFDPMQGMTPATVNVTGQLDSLKPGGSNVEQVQVTVAGQHQTVLVSMYRQGPLPLVNRTSLGLSGYLGLPPPTGTLQVNPPDSATGFQVVSIPPGITVTPSSGTGPATLTVSADLSQFPAGFARVSFTVQVGSVPVSVSVSVAVEQGGINVFEQQNFAPGGRVTVSVYGIANLPATGSWAEMSPAPTNWNGYSFVYRSRTLPILAADPSAQVFDVQFPYDLDLTGVHQAVSFLAPDGTVLSSDQTFGSEMATAITVFNGGGSDNAALKADGSVVSASNPVSRGDTIRLSILGAGVTNPPIAAGLLPDPATTVSPAAAIQAVIGGKPATILRQVLDPNFIGVTDVDIQIPNVASGLEMLGVQCGSTRIDLIPLWIAN